MHNANIKLQSNNSSYTLLVFSLPRYQISRSSLWKSSRHLKSLELLPMRFLQANRASKRIWNLPFTLHALSYDDPYSSCFHVCAASHIVIIVESRLNSIWRQRSVIILFYLFIYVFSLKEWTHKFFPWVHIVNYQLNVLFLFKCIYPIFIIVQHEWTNYVLFLFVDSPMYEIF